MRNNKYNMLLAAGLLFVFAGILLLVNLISDIFPRTYIFRFLLFSVSGGVLLYLAFTGTKPTFFIFSGLLLSCCGLLFLLTDARLIPYTLRQIWPVMVILSGIFLFPVGYARFQKMQIVYTVPGFVLAALGFIFLCFSLNIIKVPFAVFARAWWPATFIILGLGLIFLFVYTKNRKEPILFEDSEDDEEDLQ